MGLIGGTKHWRLTITGEVPPGVTPEQMQAAVTGAISVGIGVLGVVRATAFDVGDQFDKGQTKLL